jgi:hypothetical protein
MLGFKVLAATVLLAQGILAEGVHLMNCVPIMDQASTVRDYLSIVAVGTPQSQTGPN